MSGAAPVFDPDAIAHPRLRSLFDYWQGKRRGSRFPARADIDPLEMPGLLGHLIILEVAEDMLDSRYRLYGAILTHHFQTDPTGRTMRELENAAVDEIAREYAAVIERRAPVVVRNTSLMTASARRYEKLMLPLANDGRAINLILAGIFQIEMGGP